jgi:hypothetical protein
MKKFILIFIIFSSSLFAQNNFTVEWDSPFYSYFNGFIHFENSNTIPALVFNDFSDNTIKVIDGSTKSVKYSYQNPDTTYLISYAYAYTYPLDVNNDGIYDPILSTYEKLRVINGATGQVLYNNSFPGMSLIPYTIDVDGDGYVELCILQIDYNLGRVKMLILSTTSQTVGINEMTTVEPEFHLKQNYPNPFNPMTVIEYSLEKNSNIKVSLFDINGKLVKVLEEGNKPSGSYKYNFNATGLASGTYFYQLTVNGNPLSKKMLLIK